MVDCRPIVDASDEAGTIKRPAGAVGFRYVFSWANSISSMVDLAVQSTTGVKAGFSETLESQMDKILQTTAAALKEVALSGRLSRDKDASLSDDAFLDAHPERRPVVIDNFLHRSEDKAIVHDRMADWATSMVQNKIAHVIFLTSDTAFSKPLARAMPDRVFRAISLSDLEHDVAVRFVMSRLDDDAKADAGLEFLSWRIRAGQSPRQAVDDIVSESATDIFKMFLLPKAADDDCRWSPQQAWLLVKRLAEKPSLRYNQVLLSPTFAQPTTPAAASGEAALDELAAAELVALRAHQK